jgi:hypothetical protein
MATTTLTLVGNEVESHNRFGPGHQLGGQQFFTDDVVSINNAPSSGGQHSGFCVFVRKPGVWLCQAGFILPPLANTLFPNGGQIQARGLMDFSGSPPFEFKAAITGGIDDYRRAEGQVNGKFTPPKTTEWTLLIETP